MIHAGAVAAELSVAGRAFGPLAAAIVALRWGELFEALDGHGDQEYVTAIELIYEGYLFHYRECRVCDAAVHADRADALLAGDFLYARGLRLVAARGDAEAVGLLARLMSACSYLRSVGASFAADDALWAYTVSALAALRAGTPVSDASALFGRFDVAVAGGAGADVPALARELAPRLRLHDPAPLDRALAAACALQAAELPAGAAAAAC